MKNHIDQAVLSILLTVIVIKALSIIFIRINKSEYRYINERLLSNNYINLVEAKEYFSKKSFWRFLIFYVVSIIIIAFCWYYVSAFGGLYQSTYISVLIVYAYSIMIYFVVYNLILPLLIYISKILAQKYYCFSFVYLLFEGL